MTNDLCHSMKIRLYSIFDMAVVGPTPVVTEVIFAVTLFPDEGDGASKGEA